MKTICLSIFLNLPFILFCQVRQPGNINISTGADFLLPSTTLATTHNAGLGFSLKTEYVFARHTSVTVPGSMYRFPGEEETNLYMATILGGLRYYLGDFYLGAEVGNGVQFQPISRNGFMYAFSVGDEIISGARGNSLDLSIRIQN